MARETRLSVCAVQAWACVRRSPKCRRPERAVHVGSDLSKPCLSPLQAWFIAYREVTHGIPLACIGLAEETTMPALPNTPTGEAKNLGKFLLPHIPPGLPSFGPFLGAPVSGQTPLEQMNNILLEKKDRKNLHLVWKLYWHEHHRRDRFLGWLAEYQLVNSSSVVPYSLASKQSKLQAVRTASTTGSSEVRWQHGAKQCICPEALVHLTQAHNKMFWGAKERQTPTHKDM